MFVLSAICLHFLLLCAEIGFIYIERACVRVLGFYLIISAYYYQFHCKIIIIFSADILIQCDCMCIHFFGHGVGDHLGIYVYCLCPLAL